MDDNININHRNDYGSNNMVHLRTISEELPNKVILKNPRANNSIDNSDVHWPARSSDLSVLDYFCEQQ